MKFPHEIYVKRIDMQFMNLIRHKYTISTHFRSEKIRPFMQTVLEKEKVPLFHYLTDGLLSDPQYETVLQRALAMPDCPVVPFFGSFMREIRKIMKQAPSSVVLSDQDFKILSQASLIIKNYVQYLTFYAFYDI